VLVSEVAPLVAPILLLVRAAADTDPELRLLIERHDEERLARMRHNAQRLSRRGFLREGVSVDRAADVMWTLTSSDLYELLVLRRGWTARQLGEFVSDAMAAALLPPGP
jgi:hypothetical protein